MAFILFALMLSGQILQKGNLVSFHIFTPTLNPDVTFNQWKDFAINTYVPAYNKEFTGEIMFYCASGERGKFKNYLSFILVFKSVEVRDKYWPTKDDSSELYKAKLANLKPLLDEWKKLGTYSTEFTDWVIQ